MELPKQLIKDKVDTAVRSALESVMVPLYEGSQVSIPLLASTPELRKQLFYAKSLGELIFGYDSIEKMLINERHGLQKVDGNSERVSRLLMVSNDGSPRFYRELAFLQDRQGGRVLICRVDIDSAGMANILGLKSTLVKALLLTRKTAVINTLKSLLPLQADKGETKA